MSRDALWITLLQAKSVATEYGGPWWTLEVEVGGSGVQWHPCLNNKS